MRKLSVGQKKVLADFLASSAVAWLTVGIITPIISNDVSAIETVVLGIIFAAWFLLVALYLTRNVKS